MCSTFLLGGFLPSSGRSVCYFRILPIWEVLTLCVGFMSGAVYWPWFPWQGKCSFPLHTSCTCCSSSSFLAIAGADKGRIRCLISLCSLYFLALGEGQPVRNPALVSRWGFQLWEQPEPRQTPKSGQNFLDTFLFQMPVQGGSWKPSLHDRIWNNFSFNVRSKKVYFQKMTQCRQPERTCLERGRKAAKL